MDTPSSPRLQFSSDALRELCERWHVRRLAFFGSILRDDFREDSDVDLLVEFLPGLAPTLFSVEQMRRELSQVFGGRAVDLLTPASIKSRLREQILKQAVEQYAA
jgi:predicted nucleotidyltransferase